jgi:hypothetical protein
MPWTALQKICPTHETFRSLNLTESEITIDPKISSSHGRRAIASCLGAAGSA